MKKLFTLAFFIALTLQVFANPWGHRYSAEQANQNISVDVNTSFTVSVEWGEGGWDATDGTMFGYGTSTDGSGWTWVDLPWFEDGSGSNKRCKTSISISTAGKYYYAYRMNKSGSSYSFGSDSWAENSSTLSAISYILVGDVSKQDGAWNSTTTWEDGTVPTSSDNVAIMHNVSLSSTGDVASSVYIYDGKSLTIAQGGQLTVTNATTVSSSGSLTIESNSSGNGSLIGGSFSGNASVERYIEGYSASSSDGWHLISSPMTSFNVASSDFEPASGIDDLYEFDEATYMWLNYFDSGILSFASGTGYLIARKTTMTGSFTGTLNSADVAFSNLSLTSGKGEGWHLLGNPYSSALIWNESSNWIGSNIVATAKVRNESTGNYDDIATDGYIPSTNGFFVQATDASNSITIKASSRTHNATNNYKSEEASPQLILKISNDVNSFSDQCLIGFKQAATEAFDLAFDSHKLYGNATAPQLSSKMGDEIFSSNYLPPIETDYNLNLEFKAGIQANYQLKVEGMSSLNSDVFVTLEDLKTNTTVNLNEVQDYNFNGDPSDDANRFVIHIFKSALGIGDLQKSKLKVYAHNNFVMVQNQTKTAGNIQIFNLSGKKIFDNRLNNQALSSYRIDVPSGAYIVRIKAGDSSIREKIIIAKN
jgi:hypothetical protein